MSTKDEQIATTLYYIDSGVHKRLHSYNKAPIAERKYGGII